MNGLTYIRTRCNISQSELADILQVSKQAISMWENGKKEIPTGRRAELARFFGIGEEFFGEISEEQKEAILRRAMFRHDVGGREAYRFRPRMESHPCRGYRCFSCRRTSRVLMNDM